MVIIYIQRIGENRKSSPYPIDTDSTTRDKPHRTKTVSSAWLLTGKG